MNISYKKLWKLLIDKNYTKTEFAKKADIGTTTLAKLGKNQPVNMIVLYKICAYLKCNIGDIMEFVMQNGDNHA